jgi:hypothetical protein
MCPDSYEKMSNALIIKYNSLKLKAEKNKILQEKAINISYNCIYFYSLCQIQYNKINTLISSFIKSSNIKNDNKLYVSQELTRSLILIEDDSDNTTHLLKMPKIFDINLIKIFSQRWNYKDLILEDKNVETGCTNYVFYTSFPETLDYKESSIKFMSIELEHENNTHTISLKNESVNYYIVGNSLNQNFFKYYLITVLKADINKDNFDYKVSIIDHDVNFITLLPCQSIIIEENDYHIVELNIVKLNIVENNIVENDYPSDSDKSDDFIKLDANQIIYA